METLDAKAQLIVGQVEQDMGMALPPNFWQIIMQVLQAILPLLGPLCGLKTAQDVKDRLAKPRPLDIVRVARQVRLNSADAFVLSHAHDVAKAIVDVATEATAEELTAILPVAH